MSTERIYLSVPHMSGHEQAYIQHAFQTNWLTSAGANVDGFEHEVSARLEGRYTLAVSSGTAALHLVLRYLGVGAGDRVAVSTLTFAGSVFPILYLGAEPVFLDSERASWNLDADLVEEYFRDAARKDELPKALVVVHLYGQHADVARIRALCDAYGVALVEDAAESLGATYRGRETGCTADYAILSFNGNKIITTTGGGMVVARSADAVHTMRKWANQSRELAVEYVHEELGYNYRMSNVLAGIGRGQLTVLDERVAARRAVADRYREGFADLPGVSLQPEADWGTHSRWLSVLLFDPEERPVDPTTLLLAMESENIETRPVWRPMHTQPLFRHARRVGGAVAEDLFATGLCLPSSSSLSGDAQERVIDALRRVLCDAMAVSR